MNAVSLGGDSDILACITGGIAKSYYGPPSPEILSTIKRLLSADLYSITQ